MLKRLGIVSIRVLWEWWAFSVCPIAFLELWSFAIFLNMQINRLRQATVCHFQLMLTIAAMRSNWFAVFTWSLAIFNCAVPKVQVNRRAAAETCLQANSTQQWLMIAHFHLWTFNCSTLSHLKGEKCLIPQTNGRLVWINRVSARTLNTVGIIIYHFCMFPFGTSLILMNLSI